MYNVIYKGTLLPLKQFICEQRQVTVMMTACCVVLAKTSTT